METKRALPVIVIHGGALPTEIPESVATNPYLVGVKAAAIAGYRLLLQPGGQAVDAVETAVRLLEDDPIFNAGTGSRLTEDGDIEMDACIMDGRGLRSGAVAAVTKISNPISLARLVMDKTDHLLLVGEGANRFASKCGIPSVDKESLVTNTSLEKLAKLRTSTKQISVTHTVPERLEGDHDTVGAVAIDCEGHVACATSTGGITGQMAGRVGDSPLIGSGSYADDGVGAVSVTGHGESIMKVCLASRIIQLIEQGWTVQEAVTRSLDMMLERVGSRGGVIALDRHSNVGFGFATELMPWAYIKENTLHCGFRPGEHHQEHIHM